MGFNGFRVLSMRLLLATAAALTLTLNVRAGPPLNVTFPQKPPASALVNVIEDHFIGVSYELSSFDTLWGKSVDKQPTAMQNYMHNLVARMSKPLRIRLGGNGMDGSTYVRDMTAVLEHVEDDPYFNDIPVNFGPALFDLLNTMADKVGEMQFYIGLSMRTPDDYSNIQALGYDARQELGHRLDALLLGNEPDLYAGHGERDAYNISAYIPEIGDAIKALVDVGAIEEGERLVAGPTICCSWDLDDILEAGLSKYPFKYYTLQHYPKHACQGENPGNTNITYYTTHTNVEDFLGWQSSGMLQAQKDGVPVVLSEYNSVACGGSSISATFATALWAVDVGLKAATMNFSAVYLHTREFGVQYNLFDPPTEETSTEPGWRTGSPYYAALFLSEFTYPGGTIVVDMNLNNSNTSPTATVAGYGIYDSEASRASLALINYAESAQAFVIPSGLSEKLEIKILTAPSVHEKNNISWAGQTIGGYGNLEGDLDLITISCRDGCEVILPGPSAALIALKDGVLFSSNTTIASFDQIVQSHSSVSVPFSTTWICLILLLGSGMTLLF